MKLPKLAFSAAFGLAVLWHAPSAAAFCLTHGCSDRSGLSQHCEYDAQNCLITGPLLHWASSCVSFDVQKDGSELRGIDYTTARTAIVAGFAQWLNADCGGGVGPHITISDYGPVECRTAEYNQDAPNANVFMFRDDDWPYENAIDTLALTTLIFNAENGEIYDADVEVNTVQSPMTTGPVGPHDVDFSSVITHEIGHFLGLSHSEDEESTMRASYAPGETSMATIAPDDVAGICLALAPDRPLKTSSCNPRHGFSEDCSLLAENHCGFAPASPGALGTLLLTLLGLSSTFGRRKLRPSARRA